MAEKLALRESPRPLGSLGHGEEDLGGNHYFVAACEVRECTADELLLSPVGVGIGRIEEIDVEVERMAQDRAALRLGKGPRMIAPFRHPEGHATQAELGDPEPS